MKKFAVLALLLFNACAPAITPTTIIEPTSTSISTSVPPTAISTSTIEVTISPTFTPTVAVSPTPAVGMQRFSASDGMPQIYIPAGILHMGGMDVRRAPNEIPDHDVQLDAFWMDQLEVTNAMYGLCVQAGGCTPPQNFKSQS